jgi:hypothetical protein
MSNKNFIDEIEFKDIKIKVYHDETLNGCTWRMRNPDSCYTGPLYMNYETGKVTYPEDAVVPEQTERDREMLPQFLVITEKEITDDYKVKILKYLEFDYKRRNK